MVREYVLDTETKLARCRLRLGLPVAGKRSVKSARTMTLDMKRKALPEICGLADVQTGVCQCGGPPIPILDIDGRSFRSFEHDVPSRGEKLVPLGYPPEGIDAWGIRQEDTVAADDVGDGADGLLLMQPARRCAVVSHTLCFRGTRKLLRTSVRAGSDHPEEQGVAGVDCRSLHTACPPASKPISRVRKAIRAGRAFVAGFARIARG